MASQPQMTWHFDSRVAEVVGVMDREAPVRVRQALEVVRASAMRRMQQEIKTGRQYRVPGTQRYYTASAPGEAPAVRLGGLVGSINATVESKPWETIGRVGTPLDYGRELEEGTRPNVRARPWLRPSFEENRDRIRQIIGGRWM